MKKGFSLIEVIIAVALLVMVGTAMSVLNATAVKLMVSNETLTTAYALNDEGLAYLTLQRHNPDTAFDDLITDLSSPSCSTLSETGCTVYISCPETISGGCTLFGVGNKPAGIQLGRSKLTFHRSMLVKKVNADDYSVEAVTSWGNSVSQQVKVIKFIN